MGRQAITNPGGRRREKDAIRRPGFGRRIYEAVTHAGLSAGATEAVGGARGFTRRSEPRWWGSIPPLSGRGRSGGAGGGCRLVKGRGRGRRDGFEDLEVAGTVTGTDSGMVMVPDWGWGRCRGVHRRQIPHCFPTLFHGAPGVCRPRLCHGVQGVLFGAAPEV
jgi:hypothetical protein